MEEFGCALEEKYKGLLNMARVCTWPVKTESTFKGSRKGKEVVWLDHECLDLSILFSPFSLLYFLLSLSSTKFFLFCRFFTIFILPFAICYYSITFFSLPHFFTPCLFFTFMSFCIISEHTFFTI